MNNTMASVPIEETVHLAGDGVSSQFMSAKPDAQVKLRYTGRYSHPFPQKEVECEVYVARDPHGDTLMVHTLCVKCGKSQRIQSQNKEISWDKEKGLFVEPFTCPWELEGDRTIEFGLGMCSARVAYDGKVIKDA